MRRPTLDKHFLAVLIGVLGCIFILYKLMALGLIILVFALYLLKD